MGNAAVASWRFGATFNQLSWHPREVRRAGGLGSAGAVSWEGVMGGVGEGGGGEESINL